MVADGALRRISAALRHLFARRTAERIELVAWRPLHAGGVLYIADFDRRRHAFVVAPNTVCLLASYAVEDEQTTQLSREGAGAVAEDAASEAGLEATGVESGSV
jgi:hypothetical protein